MSIPNQPTPSPTGEFLSHFGAPPGSSDAVGDCKKWETLCGELLAERERLREELAKAEADRDRHLKSLFHKMCKDYVPNFDKAVGFAHLDDKPSVQELIAELESAPEN